MLKTETQKQIKIIDIVNSRVAQSEQFLSGYYPKWKSYYDMYRGIRNSQKQAYQGRANLIVNKAYSTVETVLPRLVSNKPKIYINPREPKDIMASETMEKLVDYYWDMMNMQKKSKTWVKNGLIYGTGVIKLHWDPALKLPQATILNIANKDFMFDPAATSFSDCRWAAHLYEESIEEIRNNNNYDKKAREEVTQGSKSEYETDANKKDKTVKKAPIIEYWGYIDLDGSGEEKMCIVVVANKTHILRAEESPYNHERLPFVPFVDNEDLNEYLGIGEIEPIESLQYELNDTRNQRMDNVTLSLNNMWKIDVTANIDEQELVSRPGGFVHTQNMDGILPLVPPDLTRSSYNEETLIKADIQDISGVSDYAKGMGNQAEAMANQTARGIMMMQEAGNARFRLKLQNFEDSIKEFGKQLVALIQQFMPEEMAIRIVGVKGSTFKRISKQDIKGEFDVAIEAGSTMPFNNLTRRAEARELIATVAPLAQLAGLDMKFFIQYLLSHYDIPDSAKAFAKPPEMMGMPGQPGGQGMPAEVGAEKIYGQLGAKTGAAFGGNVGNRPTPELQGMGALG